MRLPVKITSLQDLCGHRQLSSREVYPIIRSQLHGINLILLRHFFFARSKKDRAFGDEVFCESVNADSIALLSSM